MQCEMTDGEKEKNGRWDLHRRPNGMAVDVQGFILVTDRTNRELLIVELGQTPTHLKPSRCSSSHTCLSQGFEPVNPCWLLVLRDNSF